MTTGARLYGLAAVLFGVVGLAFGRFAALGFTVPPHLVGEQGLASICAALITVGGLAALFQRTAVIGALILAGVFTGFEIALCLPDLWRHPMVWVCYEAVAESGVMLLGGVIAYASATGVRAARTKTVMRLARPAFGIGLIIFGVSEFVYAMQTAALVPSWLPPSPLAWAWITGAAQILAGIAVAGGVRARLATALLILLYALFGLLVHLPRLIAAPTTADWAEHDVNLLLLGAARVLFSALGKTAPTSAELET